MKIRGVGFLFLVILITIFSSCKEETGTKVIGRGGSDGGFVFGVVDVDPILIGEDVDGWMKLQRDKRVGIVAFERFNLEGYMIFDSPTFTEAGFKPDPAFGTVLLNMILQGAKRWDIHVVIMIEAIAHIIGDIFPYSEKIKKERLTPQAVEAMIGDLAMVASKAGVTISISEEAFEGLYLDAIAKATKALGIKYIHAFEDLNCRADIYVSEDYAYYPWDAKNNPKDQDYMRHLHRMGTYFAELGMLNVMYGAAAGCGAQFQTLTAGGWGMGPKTHQNIALMRGVQFAPITYYFVVAEGDEGPIFPDEPNYVEQYDFNERLLPLLSRYARKSTDPQKPVANLIIDSPTEGEEIVDFFINSYLSSMAAVSNAMLAAGYDIVVTSRPIQGADLYYVMSPGKISGDQREIPGDLAGLANGTKPVFYQVAGRLPFTVNWKRVHGTYKIRYGGYSFEFYDPNDAGRFSLGHYIHLIDPGSYGGEVILSGMTSKDDDGVFDDPTALIIRKGNVYFINGGYIHLDASSVLANIMAGIQSKGPVYNMPSYGYLTSGKARSVLYAPYDAKIDINLPGGTRLTVFDDEGRIISSPNLTLSGKRLRGIIRRFNLAIVDH